MGPMEGYTTRPSHTRALQTAYSLGPLLRYRQGGVQPMNGRVACLSLSVFPLTGWQVQSDQKVTLGWMTTAKPEHNLQHKPFFKNDWPLQCKSGKARGTINEGQT